MKKKIFVLFCAAALAAAGSVSTFAAESSSAEQRQQMPKTIQYYGTLQKTGETGSGKFLLNGQPAGSAEKQDVILNLSDETLILNAADGLPVAAADIQDGEMACVYVSPAMALSYPPQMSAYVILTKIPAGCRVPSLEEVRNLAMNEDGSAVVETVSGVTYQVPADCIMVPYLTRNMVYVSSLTEGTNFLVWSEPSQDGQTEKASKITVFLKGQLAFDEPSGPAEEAEMNVGLISLK